MLPMESGAEFGMLVVETIAKIRRAHFVDGKPIKQICRELKLSRKVVRKVLRSEATAFEYKRSVQPHPKLGAWRKELERLLAANAARTIPIVCQRISPPSIRSCRERCSGSAKTRTASSKLRPCFCRLLRFLLSSQVNRSSVMAIM